MARLATRFKGKLIYLWLPDSEHPVKAKCLGLTTEAGEACYLIQYEDGLKETVFVNSVLRIVSAEKIEKAAQVYDLAQRRAEIKIVN